MSTKLPTGPEDPRLVDNMRHVLESVHAALRAPPTDLGEPTVLVALVYPCPAAPNGLVYSVASNSGEDPHELLENIAERRRNVVLAEPIVTGRRQ